MSEPTPGTAEPLGIGHQVTDGRRLGVVVAIQPAGIHPAAESPGGLCYQVAWENGRTSWVLAEEVERVGGGLMPAVRVK